MGKSSKKKGEGNNSSSSYQDQVITSETEVLNEAHKKMLQWLKTVKFKKTLLGGVSEQDVWKKLSELNELYEASLLAERVRYDTLVSAYAKSRDAELEKYKQAVRDLQANNAASYKEG